MSIASEINRISGAVETQYDLLIRLKSALAGKGLSDKLSLQDKTITENGTYTADEGYDGLGTVMVNVPSSGEASNVDVEILERTITQYSNSRIESIGSYAFYLCNRLVSVNLPSVISIKHQAFNGCSVLTSFYAPNVTAIYPYAFAGCSVLTKLDFNKMRSFSDRAFNNATGLVALILRGSEVVTLSGANIFNGSPIANGTGYIYVPSALVSSYKSATNWSVVSAQIRAIEDYPEICG